MGREVGLPAPRQRRGLSFLLSLGWVELKKKRKMKWEGKQRADGEPQILLPPKGAIKGQESNMSWELMRAAWGPGVEGTPRGGGWVPGGHDGVLADNPHIISFCLTQCLALGSSEGY